MFMAKYLHKQIMHIIVRTKTFNDGVVLEGQQTKTFIALSLYCIVSVLQVVCIVKVLTHVHT